MQKTDLKVGTRVRVKIYPKTCHGKIVEQRKTWGEWEHKIVFDDGTKASDFQAYYQKKFEDHDNGNGSASTAVWRYSRDISCKVDDNNEPALTTSQERRKREAIKKQMAITMKQDAVNDLIRKLGMLGIEAFQGRVQRKYGEHRVEVLSVPMADAHALLELLEPAIAKHVNDMFEMFEDGETPDE